MLEEGEDGQADPQCHPDLHREREGEQDLLTGPRSH